MALILSLDSTTAVCSVALHLDGQLLASEFIPTPRAASSKLMMSAKKLIENNSIRMTDLSAVAVSQGPGSFTGLRIATSAAKGLCLALNIPLIAVNSLILLTYPTVFQVKSDFYCPMIDARRMEVYCALYTSNLAIHGEIEAKVLTSESFQEQLAQYRVTFFGDGSTKFKSLTNHPNAIFVEGVQPEAKNLGFLAFHKFAKKEFESLENFEPFYLKDFMIKRKL